MTQVTMNALDAISGSLATAYVTFKNGKRYNLFQLYEFLAKKDVDSVKVPILGRTGKGNKPASWGGKFTGKAHYNQSVFREYALEYKKTGKMEPFEITIENHDASSSAGSQIIILKGCLLDSIVLAKFDANSEILDEEISGTFDDWEMPQAFNIMEGMQ